MISGHRRTATLFLNAPSFSTPMLIEIGSTLRVYFLRMNKLYLSATSRRESWLGIDPLAESVWSRRSFFVGGWPSGRAGF
jgi:hypothetical protein